MTKKKPVASKLTSPAESGQFLFPIISEARTLQRSSCFLILIIDIMLKSMSTFPPVTSLAIKKKYYQSTFILKHSTCSHKVPCTCTCISLPVLGASGDILTPSL